MPMRYESGITRQTAPISIFWTAGLGIDVGWELDFWGKFRRGIESADAGYFASIAQYDDIQVLVAAQAASFYTAIRTIEMRLLIAHENAALQERSLEITERLFRSGNESELDVQQARTLYLSTLATIPELEASLRQTQNALGVLLGRPPGPLPEMEAERERIPEADLGILADVPADLLRRRPDVRAAELQMAAQSARIGVSESELYPAIALTGSVVVSATSMTGQPTTLRLWTRSGAGVEHLRLGPVDERRCWCRTPASSNSSSSTRTPCCKRPGSWTMRRSASCNFAPRSRSSRKRCRPRAAPSTSPTCSTARASSTSRECWTRSVHSSASRSAS